ncbi:Peptide hydrolase {ECO:0000256/RuleBase:RU361240} {ECO:0000256/RuleBase:RU361240} [Serendipita indica DSM 11827]|nr:Peptide hydrolase {ECO:0000256/RuleBase:RU361240} {ECO:0000256/RuleBase:RU361240} [Serendipita indica DSM 11827]
MSPLVGGPIVAARATPKYETLVVIPQERSFTSHCDASFRGTYHNAGRPLSLYATSSACTGLGDTPIEASVSLESTPSSDILFWVEEIVTDGQLRAQSHGAPKIFIESVIDSHQVSLSGSRTAPGKILWFSETAAILSIPEDQISTLDMHLSPLWEAVRIPVDPLPIKASTESDSDKRLRKILSTVHFNPDISSILSSISLARMLFDIRWLTGEASDSPIISRHSFSDGARVAAKWIRSKMEEYGAACEYMDFLEGFAPNIICRYAANPDGNSTEATTAKGPRSRLFRKACRPSQISRSLPPCSTRAPGGDDDGSGVVHLLSIARAISTKSVYFNVDVELCAFAGEEQGLLGSSAYAKKLYEDGEDILLMIQADMLAYHSSEEPMQLGLPQAIGSPVAAELVANISSIYAPELTVGITAACCSDHQSFWQYGMDTGFSATQVFERAGDIIDPMYHNSGDLSNRTNYDLNQVHSIAKVTLATLLHTAGFGFSSDN